MEIDWKEELLASQSFNKKEEKLLKYGAKSLTDSWYLGALYLGALHFRPMVELAKF